MINARGRNFCTTSGGWTYHPAEDSDFRRIKRLIRGATINLSTTGGGTYHSAEESDSGYIIWLMHTASLILNS